MRRRMEKGCQEEMRGKGSSKIRLLLVDIELRKRYKEGQLEDRRRGKWWKRETIISSSLYKSISEPQSLWQWVLKNITAVTEGLPYNALCCNYKRIWRPLRAIQSNNYCFAVEVSSSKPVHKSPLSSPAALHCPALTRGGTSLRRPFCHM